eukprot:TRINITY_DN1067_c0_g1_i2.p3 TRINITY_DN1067_c0_g1~~TRINITY_DN1067_c0_g1_i2.p3  ORF type:complete len:152 (+),score=27.37 TRINITY_DN1067_c0_g1_i2:910-1365(+)
MFLFSLQVGFLFVKGLFLGSEVASGFGTTSRGLLGDVLVVLGSGIALSSSLGVLLFLIVNQSSRVLNSLLLFSLQGADLLFNGLLLGLVLLLHSVDLLLDLLNLFELGQFRLASLELVGERSDLLCNGDKAQKEERRGYGVSRVFLKSGRV